MKHIDYEISEEDVSDEIPKKILEPIYFSVDVPPDLQMYILENSGKPKFKIRRVKSTFYLADNEYDLKESNNDLYEIGVERVSMTSFTGGAIIIEYVRLSDGIIVHGNEEQGYNIFILE